MPSALTATVPLVQQPLACPQTMEQECERAFKAESQHPHLVLAIFQYF